MLGLGGLSLSLGSGRTGGASNISIPFGARFVALGDSLISQKSNARGVNNPVAIYTFRKNGALRPSVGADQGISGQRMDQFFSRINYTTGQMPDVVFLDGGTNDISASATLQQLKDREDANIAAIWTANPDAVIIRIGVHVGTSQSGAATTIADFNAYMAAKHKTTAGNAYFYVPIPAEYDAATWTHDGTHWSKVGANGVANAIATVVDPFLSTGNAFLTTASGYHGANLSTRTAQAGTSGTVTGLEDGSQVATGKTVSFTGLTGGTVAASKGTLSGQTSQIIQISAASASATGTVTYNDGSTSISGAAGEVFEFLAYVKITAADGVSAPVGLNWIYGLLGSASNFANAANEAVSFPATLEGGIRVWPIALRVASGSLTPQIQIGTLTGAVDIRVEIILPIVRKTELVAYAAPLYLGSDGIKTSTETLRITGTPGVGNVLTGEPGTYSGGGLSYGQQWYNNTVAIGGATAFTYTQQAGDSGDSVTFGSNPTNSFGSASERSTAVNVP